MKNIRKLLALVLALALVFALSACGSEPKGTVTPGGSGNSPSGTITADTETPEPEDDVELGSMNGGIYKNDFVGIGCKLTEDWTYYSEEEILEINGLVADAMDNEDLTEQLRSSGSVYDMVAAADGGLTSVNVVIENLGVIYGHTLDASGYIDIALESLESQLSTIGVTTNTCEKVSFDFCGKATDGIYIVGTMSAEGVEVDMYQRMACVKVGNYMFCVTACSYLEDITTDILDLFYAL